MITVDGYTFEGKYAKLCSDFIMYKRSIGYKYTARTVRRVKYLNQHLSLVASSVADDDYSLGKDTVEAFVSKRPSESPRTQQTREIIIRQFAIYLDSIGISAYIAPALLKWDSGSTFTPYIFTHEQISTIINVVDNLEYEYRSPHYHYVYPLLIRILYCCGLRISEALSIKIEDIDFDEGLIRIEQAKFNNSRLIPLSESLYKALVVYLSQVGLAKTSKGFLFRTKWDKPYKPQSIYHRFKDFMKAAGIPHTEKGGLPRLHDVRHTFAVHSLDNMVAQGVDAYHMLPYLSVFMGHRCLKATEKYLRLTPTAFNDIVSALTPLYGDLFQSRGEAVK